MTAPILRILADENLPRVMVQAIRDAGHDVVWIREIARSLPDDAILQMASEQGRLVLTGDKDFGDLTFERGVAATTGIILIRARGSGSGALTSVVLDALSAARDWHGSFTVIEPHRVRVTWTRTPP